MVTTKQVNLLQQIKSNQIRNQHRFGGYCNYVRKSILPESNQDLTGKQNTFQISKNTLDDIRERINNFNVIKIHQVLKEHYNY